MTNIFEVATKISTPLMLGGVFALAFFLILREIVKKNIFPILTKSVGAGILKLIIDRLFVLALIALILGFIAYILPMFVRETTSTATSANTNTINPNSNTQIFSNNNQTNEQKKLAELNGGISNSSPPTVSPTPQTKSNSNTKDSTAQNNTPQNSATSNNDNPQITTVELTVKIKVFKTHQTTNEKIDVTSTSNVKVILETKNKVFSPLFGTTVKFQDVPCGQYIALKFFGDNEKEHKLFKYIPLCNKTKHEILYPFYVG